MNLRPLFKFLRKTDGSATVETVLWFPIFMAVFGLMLDVAMIFYGQTKVLRVVHEGNREYSIGRLGTTEDVETFVEASLLALDIQGEATTVNTAGVAHTLVSVPAAQLQILGYFSVLRGLTITVSAEHTVEYWEG